MVKRSLFMFILISACMPPLPEPFIPPPLKMPTDSPNELSEGLLTEYDIWDFLKGGPNEYEVIQLLGAPDSIWVSDEQPFYIMYYYRSVMADYNSIELNTKSRVVTGYEWDE
ncbi:MAG: hypothetical protein ISR82_05605 [Candidatus Marinimicrobia bacterium]|nr:hypothetical protein [Candidatus Neomarinimicrobiota bacterium]MBL7031135.1 hypothetical protein [Candidatus Neomarinimicrobiota bacterium]